MIDLAQDSDVASGMGYASGHLVDLSIAVNRYLYPFEYGRGPTMSTWISANLRFGCGKEPMWGFVCLVILDIWHFWHVFVHFVISLEIPSHMNFSLISLEVDLIEGCDNPWIRLNTSFLWSVGTMGLGFPVLTSHMIVMLEFGTFKSSKMRDVVAFLKALISGSEFCFSANFL